MPKSDYLVLVDMQNKENKFFVGWEDAMVIAGQWLEDEGYDPPRWRYHGWPPDTTVERLRERAVANPGL